MQPQYQQGQQMGVQGLGCASLLPQGPQGSTSSSLAGQVLLLLQRFTHGVLLSELLHFSPWLVAASILLHPMPYGTLLSECPVLQHAHCTPFIEKINIDNINILYNIYMYYIYNMPFIKKSGEKKITHSLPSPPFSISLRSHKK